MSGNDFILFAGDWHDLAPDRVPDTALSAHPAPQEAIERGKATLREGANWYHVVDARKWETVGGGSRA